MAILSRGLLFFFKRDLDTLSNVDSVDWEASQSVHLAAEDDCIVSSLFLSDTDNYHNTSRGIPPIEVPERII